MKRPLTVTLVGCLFLAAGIVGIGYHAAELKTTGVGIESAWVLTVRGSNIARWLLVIWIAYHVALSFFHSGVQLLTHILFGIIVLLGLFNAKANLYFKSA